MYDAVVLAGGAARRMNGIDKTGLRIGPDSLLERVLTAVSAANRTVVVGPTRLTSRPVHWSREEPPGGGPVAAIAAGLEFVTADRLVVLAADLPWIAPAVPRLLSALSSPSLEYDASVLVDPTGRRNYLASGWRTVCLRRALHELGPVVGAPARQLFPVDSTVDVPDPADTGADCDSWPDIERARDRLAHERTSP